MAKSPRVTFKPNRIAEGDWQIQAICPGVETKFIGGFKSKAEIDEWLNGDGKIKWLRSQGYATGATARIAVAVLRQSRRA